MGLIAAAAGRRRAARIRDPAMPYNGFGRNRGRNFPQHVATYLLPAIKEVPRRGLEPLLLAEPDPKSGASANFATSASSQDVLLKPFL